MDSEPVEIDPQPQPLKVGDVVKRKGDKRFIAGIIRTIDWTDEKPYYVDWFGELKLWEKAEDLEVIEWINSASNSTRH